jgi:hypothetical protein
MGVYELVFEILRQTQGSISKYVADHGASPIWRCSHRMIFFKLSQYVLNDLNYKITSSKMGVYELDSEILLQTQGNILKYVAALGTSLFWRRSHSTISLKLSQYLPNDLNYK